MNGDENEIAEICTEVLELDQLDKWKSDSVSLLEARSSSAVRESDMLSLIYEPNKWA